jgi:hypothetical protein
MYKIRLKQFESKNHSLLVNMFKHMDFYWKKQELTYNEKISMDYNTFVRYCFSVS